jgi:hypothetical protein
MAFVPDNSFSGLPEERQELWDIVPGTDYVPSDELAEAQTLYAIGFGYRADEYDQMGLTPETVYDMRQQFFDYMGMSDDQFPWDEWREAMGYE